MFRYYVISIVYIVNCGKFKKSITIIKSCFSFCFFYIFLFSFPYKIRSECTYFLYQFFLLHHKMIKCRLSGLQVSRISSCCWYVSTIFSYFSGIFLTYLKIKPMFYTIANVLGLKIARSEWSQNFMDTVKTWICLV